MDISNFLEDLPPESPSINERVKIGRDELKERLDFYAGLHDDFEATEEHLDAMEEIFGNHSNVFLTGGAGTGKTTFVRTVVMPELDFRNLHWAVTATTGIAGSHLEGKTINSFFGIGFGPEWVDTYPRDLREFWDEAPVGEPAPSPQDMSDEELKRWYAMFFKRWMTDASVRQNVRAGVIKRLISHEVVLIDEISMCAGDALLGYLDYMLKELRGDERPFGGLQLIKIGDFSQLPPVDELPGASRPDWAFMSSCWKVAPIELTHVFRQGDPEFIGFLNNIRVGKITNEDREFAQRHVRVDMTQEETRLYPFLVPKNDVARRINLGALDNYEGPTRPLEAEFQIEPGVQNLKPWEVKNISGVKEKLVKNMRLVSTTTFVRVGTPVMFTINDPGGEYVNGTRGFIREVNLFPRNAAAPEDMDYLVIGVPSMKPGEEERKIILRRWAYSRERHEDPFRVIQVPPGFNEENQKSLPPMISYYPTVRQFPMIPATAITIHKSQGMSLERAILVLDSSFAAGQVYVGLSRLTSPEGMILVSSEFEAKADPLVMEYYQSIRDRKDANKTAIGGRTQSGHP